MTEKLSIGDFGSDGCCTLHGTNNLMVDLNHKMEISSATLLYHREKTVGFVGNALIITRVLSLQVLFFFIHF